MNIAALRLSLRRVKCLARAEVLHIRRDRATLAQVLVMPLVQLLVLSNVATFAIRATPTYVVDEDRSDASRGAITRLASTGLFRITAVSSSPRLADDAMLDGRATMVLTIPPEFERSLVRDRVAPVHLDVNAEKGAAAGVVQSYAARILADYAAELDDVGRPDGPRRGAGHIEVPVRGWYNPSLDYRHYMVPGLLVALVTMIGTLLAAQNLAREKEAGTLEQLNATPITRAEFITAKLLPLWVLAMVDLTLGLVVGKFAFGVPMRGSMLLLFGTAAIYLVVALSIGLWISTLVETQQQAMFVTFFLVMVYLLMSGLFTPIDSTPDWVQAVSLVNPVRHFVSIARAVLIKGAGVGDVWRSLVALGVSAVVALTFAVRQYSKRVA